jgi:hypothetical protein
VRGVVVENHSDRAVGWVSSVEILQ